MAADLMIAHTRAATDSWADIVEDANTYGQVIVTDDDRSDVVVMSVDEFAKMRRKLMESALAKLDAEIDRQVAVMNAPGAHERWRAIMDATPQEIADAVNAAEARSRKS